MSVRVSGRCPGSPDSVSRLCKTLCPGVLVYLSTLLPIKKRKICLLPESFLIS